MPVTTSPRTASPKTSSPAPPLPPPVSLVSRPWFPPLVLTLLCAFSFFYGLSAGELYRTESLRAILAAEFLRSGDWIVPRLYGEPLFTKPPGMYAAIALCSLPFGRVTEATARLPSALAATATVLLFYWYFRRQLGTLGGLVAATILPLSKLWLDKVPSAEIDMLQVAWVAAANIFFFRALEAEEDEARSTNIEIRNNLKIQNPNPRQPQGFVSSLLVRISDLSRISCFGFRIFSTSWPWWIAALLCVAGGVMTKWTAPAFFYGTAIPLLWWRGRLRLLWGRRHLISAALGAGLCFTWAGLAIALTGWDVFYHTVSREALMRISPLHHDRPYPWLEALAHPFILFAAMLPWSVCLFWALRPSFVRLWDDRGRRLLQAMHCWIWPNLIFWSSIPEHATRHSFPLCAGVVGLAAMVWVAWLTGRLAWPLPRIRPVSFFVGVVAFWIVVKLAYVHGVIPMRSGTREPRAKAAQIAAAVPESATLYVFLLKDEGIMFYYGRPVRRLHNLDDLPCAGEPLYCILEKTEWQNYDGRRPAEAILWLCDEQAAEIVVVRLDSITRPLPSPGTPGEGLGVRE